MTKARNFKNVTQKEINAMQDFTNSLPDNAFEMVPDDGEVSIIISGFFFRSIVRTLDYLISTADPKEVIRATEYMKLNYDTEKCDMTKITPLDSALWTITNIITEFNIQAGLQKKSKVYDKTAVHKLMEDMAIENKLPPLSTDEIEKRIKMQELAKRKKDENADGSTSEEDFVNQAFGD